MFAGSSRGTLGDTGGLSGEAMACDGGGGFPERDADIMV